MLPGGFDFERCYAAVRARDLRFDGLFFTGLASSGIYCRPVCPARTPRAAACRFYRTAAAAEHDGYRPCPRCRPELAPARSRHGASWAEAVFQQVQTRALEPLALAAVARDVGLSARQLGRLLAQAFGVTPRAIIRTERLLFAKKLLEETDLSMATLARAAGFSSVAHLNAVFGERYGLAPSGLRRARRLPRRFAPARDGTIRLRLGLRQPFAWDAALAYLAGRATPGVEAVIDGAYWRTVQCTVGKRVLCGWIEVRSNPEQSSLTVTVPAHLAAALHGLCMRLRVLFDLDLQAAEIDAALAADDTLARLVAMTPGLRVIGAWEPFELALRAVLGQQISVAGANTLAGRLARRFGEALATPHAHLSHLAATANSIARSTPEEVAALGMPRSRAATVVALARFSAEGGLAFAIGTPLKTMVAELARLPGIGSWTAQYIAMRAFGQPDAFPAGDLGLKRALAQLEGKARGAPAVSEAALEARSLAWRPWRAYAAAHLWRAGARPGA